MIGLDFGNCCPIQWNPNSSQPSREGVLRHRRSKDSTCFSNSLPNNILYGRASAHMKSLSAAIAESVLE